jgi:hypothetical protein
MLIQLLPEQISRNWDVIGHSVEEALPPTTEWTESLKNNVLTMLLCGRMQCWVSCDDNTKKIEAIITTLIAADTLAERKDLMVYTLYGVEKLSGKSWTNGFAMLSRWGRSMGCNRMIAYSGAPVVLHMIQRMGGDTGYHFVTLDLVKE